MKDIFSAIFANWTTIALAASGLLAVVASYFAGIDQHNQSKRIETLSTKNNTLTKSISNSIETNNQLTATNNELMEKNVELSDYIKNEITGGDSYMYLTLSGVSPTVDQYGIRFAGQHAMRDITLSVTDKELESKVTSMSAIVGALNMGGVKAVQDLWGEAVIYRNNWNRYIQPNNVFQPLQNVPHIKINETKTLTYIINSANGVLIGHLFLRKDDTGKVIAVEHLRKDQDVLYEKPDNYPKMVGEGGTVSVLPDWTKL